MPTAAGPLLSTYPVAFGMPPQGTYAIGSADGSVSYMYPFYAAPYGAMPATGADTDPGSPTRGLVGVPTPAPAGGYYAPVPQWMLDPTIAGGGNGGGGDAAAAAFYQEQGRAWGMAGHAPPGASGMQQPQVLGDGRALAALGTAEVADAAQPPTTAAAAAAAAAAGMGSY